MFPNKGRIEDRLDRIEAVLRLAGITSEPDQPKPMLASPVMVSALFEAMATVLGLALPADDLSARAKLCRKQAVDLRLGPPPAPGVTWAERNAPAILEAVASLYDNAAAWRRGEFMKGELGKA